MLPPVKALGYNGQWPGPTLRVNQGDKVRAIFRNNLKETTGVHFHGVEFDDFFQDGVPFVTQKPIVPGEEYAYEFTANNAGSLMYHSHHNATDQVGRGLLGRVHRRPAAARRRRTTASTSGSRTTPSAGSRSTATASRPSSRSSPRRASACCCGS